MDFKLNLNDQIKIFETVNTVFQKNKKYYKKRPLIFLINIFLIIMGGFYIHPLISVIISLCAEPLL